MATILSIANQKGGVGKTTVAFNLGWALTKLQSRVLLVDNDPQGNLTRYCGADEDEHPSTIDEIYVDRRSRGLDKSVIVHLTERLGLLASDPMLAGVEYYLMTRADKEFVLKKALAPVLGSYDFVLIDNPPALNLLTVNGLVASDAVIIPVQLEFFSLEGIVLLTRTIESLKDRNPMLRVMGIVPNMFDDRRKLNWEVFEALKKEFGSQVFETKIHDSVKIAESSGHGRCILDYSPQSRSTKEYLNFAQEILDSVKDG